MCRAGLEQHPAYLSARITLGRALLEAGELGEAATEFEYVLRAAPDNLTAIRELADIHQRRRVSNHQSRSHEREAHQLPVEETAVREASVWAAPERIEPPAPTSFVPEPEPLWAAVSEREPEPLAVSEPEPAPDPVLVELEAWLAVLAADRVNRSPHV